MKNGYIFIVDDSLTNLRALHSYLEQAGFDVVDVPNGERLFQELDSSLPDLILLDILMPGMDGFGICRRLKERDETKAIPVIFMTALSDSLDKVHGFEAGGVDYLIKPLDPQEVVVRVTTHLKLQRLQEQLKAQNVRLEDQNVLLEAQNTRLASEIAERIRTEQTLTETLAQIELAKQEWEVTADSLSHVVCLLDADMRIIRANRSVETWHLSDVAHVKGTSLHDLLHAHCADDSCYLRLFLQRAHAGVASLQPTEYEGEDPLLRRVLNLQIRPIAALREHQDHATSSFAVCVVEDVTKRTRVEQALQERTQELFLLNKLNNALQRCKTPEETYPVIVGICQELFPESSGSLSVMNKEKTSFQEAAFWGSPPDSIRTFGADDFWIFDHASTKIIDHPETEELSTYIGYSFDQQSLCIPVKDSGEILAILSIDLTLCRRAYSEEEYAKKMDAIRLALNSVVEQYVVSFVNLNLRARLRQESILDPLTGLYNRRHMEISLSRETRRAQRHNTPLGIMMLDVDHFKRLNDTYSHEAGDVVLKELGSLLLRHIRAEDIACRYGGEEFLLILPEATLPDIRQRAEEIRIMAKELQIRYRQDMLHFTISVGIAALPEHGFQANEIIHAADIALYQAKSHGRDRVEIA